MNKIQYFSYRIVRKIIMMSLSLTENDNIFSRALYSAKINLLTRKLKHCGERLRVQFPILISEPEYVTIGDDVSLAAYVHIWGGGGVTIGSRVMIGTHTSISSLTHDYTQNKMYNTLIKKSVMIHDDVWIGSNCVILPGVEIGPGTVIGAGSVVTKNTPSNAIMVGVPAQVMKKRFPDG